jgi:uncharacterized membrane protein YbhN (UPF0104 family)
MGIAVWLVGPERLRAQLAQIDRRWFGAALLAAVLAQGFSVARWGSIARVFGLRVRTGALAVAYAQGMTINVLLPGATLGGDALRSLRLQALGNPLGVSALTVLLDRLSGLWVLCLLSLLTGAGWLIALVLGAPLPALPLPADLGRAGVASGFAAYLGGLALLCAIPWLPLRLRSAPATGPATVAAGQAAAVPAGLATRIWTRIVQWHDLARAQRAALGRTLWLSLVVQVLCAAALWLCALAAGGRCAYWQVQALAAPVFIAGALPLSYGGFGAREITALAIFPLVGLPADLGLTASALYGILAVVLGLAAAPAFAVAVAGPGKPGSGA